MLPWLLELGLGVVDLGLAAAAVALVVEGLPNRRRLRRTKKARPCEDVEDDEETDPAEA